LKSISVVYAVFLIIAACAREAEPDDPYLPVKQVAWAYLTEYQKSTVNTDWKKAPVQETVHQGVAAFSVIFHTKDDILLGPIIVYVDASDKHVLGQASRD
jgi:hypothetical protein